MARIKKVFTSSDQVLHLWANQSQDEARCKNVFFNGKSVWSYGMHYELGRLHTVKGHTVALINSDRYSVTTSKHQSQAKSATSHLISLYSSNVGSVETALREKQEKIIDSLMNRLSDLKPHEIDDYDKRSIEKFNSFCEKLGFKKLQIPIQSELFEIIKEHISFRNERNKTLKAFRETPEYAEKRAKVAEAKAQRELQKAAEQIEVWKNGGPITNSVRNLNPQLIRINGNEIQTSRGASVPKDEAYKLMLQLNHGTAKVGQQIGSFTLDKIEKDLVKIGCHTISLVEARKTLGQVV